MQLLKAVIKRRFPALAPLVHVLKSKVGCAVGSTPNPMTMADVFARIYDINYWGLLF